MSLWTAPSLSTPLPLQLTQRSSLGWCSGWWHRGLLIVTTGGGGDLLLLLRLLLLLLILLPILLLLSVETVPLLREEIVEEIAHRGLDGGTLTLMILLLLMLPLLLHLMAACSAMGVCYDARNWMPVRWVSGSLLGDVGYLVLWEIHPQATSKQPASVRVM